MAVENVPGTGAASGAGAAAAAKSGAADKNALGSQQFLTLMVTQLKNQDPFKPMDATQYVSQLAEFSNVSGIAEMNKSISTLTDSMMGSQVLGGSTLIGREVVADASTVALGASGAVRGSVEMPKGASEAALVVTDTAGQIVRRMPLSPAAGTQDFSWNGVNDLGERAPPGNYTVQAIANVGGAAYQLPTSLVSKVDSVTIDPTSHSLTLNTAIGPVALASVRRVM